MPGNNASVIPATSIGHSLKYVHKINPIEATNSPNIGINIQGLERKLRKLIKNLKIN